VCAEVAPELVALDGWGYPVLADGAVVPTLAEDARRACVCPVLCLVHCV